MPTRFRPEVPAALERLRSLGIRLPLLTGDRRQAATAIAKQLHLDFEAEVLPQDKIRSSSASSVKATWRRWWATASTTRPRSLRPMSFRTIKQNLWFTAGYNVLGMGLAATGWLPPIVAAAAQSLPDVAVMLNSSRFLRGR